MEQYADEKLADSTTSYWPFSLTNPSVFGAALVSVIRALLNRELPVCLIPSAQRTKSRQLPEKSRFVMHCGFSESRTDIVGVIRNTLVPSCLKVPTPIFHSHPNASPWPHSAHVSLPVANFSQELVGGAAPYGATFA